MKTKNKVWTETESIVLTLLNVEVVEFHLVNQVLSVFGRNRLVMSQDQVVFTADVRRVVFSQTPASLNAKISMSVKTQTNARHMKEVTASTSKVDTGVRSRFRHWSTFH